MAVAAGVVWEIRSTATGSNANGGGFKAGASGTDWSQQDAAQYNLSGITSSGSGNVLLTASASADMVGNILHMVSGTNFTPGWFEITSVSVGVSITCSTNQAGTAVSVGIGATGVANIGGAISLNSSLDSSFFGSMAGGNIAWVKGSLTLGQAVSAFNGGSQAPIMIQGYNSSRGDNPTGANRPSINCGANTLTTGTNVQLKGIIFTGTGTALITMGAGGVATNCKVTNTSTTAGRTALNFSAANQFIVNCECISYRGIAMAQGSSAVITGCYIHDSDIGLKNSGAVVSAYINNIITSCVTAAIQISAADTADTLYWGNTLYGAENNLGIGLSLASGTTLVRFLNNIVYGFATGVSHADSGQTVSYDDFNNYFNNTADVTNFTKGGSDIALNPQFASVAQVTGTAGTVSSSTITDAAASFSGVTNNRDFVYVISGTGATAGQYMITSHTATSITLDSAPGGSGTNIVYQVTTGRNFAVGANMANAGFPGTFPGGITAGYLDIGAAQEQYTDPGVAQVLSGTSYTYSNATEAGTSVSTDPGTTNVKTGTTYTINSVNKTGSYSPAGTGGGSKGHLGPVNMS